MNRETEKNMDSVSAEKEAIADDTERTVICPAIEPAGNSRLSDSVTIRSTYVKNEKGEFVMEIAAGERYTIGIVTEFHEDLDQVIVGFSMNNAKGIVFLSSNTFAQTKTNFNVKAGT